MSNPFRSNRIGGAALAVVLIVLAWVAYHNLSPARQEPRSCYSVDDGKTYFFATYRVPPFDYHGQQAVRAIVYTFHDGKPPAVAYLMRYTPEAKAQLEAAPPDPGSSFSTAALAGLEVKRPGDAKWVPALGPTQQPTQEYEDITAVRARDDGRLPMPLMPE